MALLVSLGLAVVAAIVLTFAKAVVEYRAILGGRYSWQMFLAVGPFWVVLTLLSLNSQCNPAGCSWGLRFDWLFDILRSIPALTQTSGEVLVVFTFTGFLVLSVYVVGHALAWLFWSTRGFARLFRP
jgi:hypothetical protein